ncbi:hypothetical protein [Pantoea ananatis]
MFGTPRSAPSATTPGSALAARNVELLSTGGTAKALREAGLAGDVSN